MKFSIRTFMGIIPILENRKLLNGHASSAIDCDLKGTDLRVFNQAVVRGSVQDNSLEQKSAFVINSKQIFTFRDDVNATWGPIQHDEEISNKIYIDSGFLGYPIYTTKELGIPVSPDSDYYGPPINYRRLGVPAPVSECEVDVDAVSSGVIQQVGTDDVTMEDGITVINDAVIVTCDIAHGLVNGDRVDQNGLDWQILNTEYIISSVSDARPNSEREYVLRGMTWTYLFESSPSVEERAEGDPPVEGENWWPTPGSGTWSQVFTDVSEEDRIYVYTYVTDQGEEGPPSPPSILVTLGPGQGVTLTFPGAPDIEGFFVDKIRIYRTIPTSTGAADYYYVDEIPVSTGNYYDIKLPIELGELLPSLEWDPPPEGLTGLITMPNGIMVGFKDNTIYLSEPYQPHAWPRSYTKAVDDVIVGIAAFGQSVVIATDDKPYVGTLTDPLSLTFKKMGTVEPCISKRACLSLGYGVMYPSPNGLILVEARGVKNVLNDMWDDTEWRKLYGSYQEIFAHVHNERYYLTFSNGTNNSVTYIFNPQVSPIMITQLNEGAYTGGGVDRDEDKFFMLGVKDGPTGSRVIELDPDSGENGRLITNWVSQTFVMPLPCNMGAAQVFYEYDVKNVNVLIVITAVGVKGKIWIFTKTMEDQEPFRLPSGFLAREWKVRVITDTPVQEIYVAETIEELRGDFAT